MRQVLSNLDERSPAVLDSESQVAIGIANNGRLVEVFSAGDGSTWTIVMTTPQGKSCVVASGEDWYLREKATRGPEA